MPKIRDLKAIDAFATLRPSLTARCGQESTDRLAAAIDGLRFACALVLLADLTKDG